MADVAKDMDAIDQFNDTLKILKIRQPYAFELSDVNKYIDPQLSKIKVCIDKLMYCNYI